MRARRPRTFGVLNFALARPSYPSRASTQFPSCACISLAVKAATGRGAPLMPGSR
jgi:hypothetical protein